VSSETQKLNLTEDEDTVTVADLLEEQLEDSELQRLAEVEVPEPLKEPVDEEELGHREFDDGSFWRAIPAFREVSREEFLDHRFQLLQTVTSVEQLDALLADLVSQEFLQDVHEGLRQAPMNMRLSPYILARIDWERPYEDPVRRQFIPVASTREPDHPKLTLDSLHEQEDSPTPGLVHRYPDKALFLPLDVCPVYCRYCTRSYAIGNDTELVDKVQYRLSRDRWDRAFAYLASRPEVEDVVVSGGDVYMLPATMLREIGQMLLAIPHIRRIRFASKGPAVMPMKILSDRDWAEALCEVAEMGREECKEVCFHTHFNTVNEISDITRRAMNLLFRRGIKVRNQSVLIRGVNDDPEHMVTLVRKLALMNVQPYYVYQHDMVQGVEELRTRVADTVEIERQVRGSTAGFNTPVFVNDVPGGGGKRDVHSYDHYDEVTGVSVYRSPSVDEDKVYLYFDPMRLLPQEGQQRWADPAQHRQIVREAIAAAGLEDLEFSC